MLNVDICIVSCSVNVANTYRYFCFFKFFHRRRSCISTILIISGLLIISIVASDASSISISFIIRLTVSRPIPFIKIAITSSSTIIIVYRDEEIKSYNYSILNQSFGDNRFIDTLGLEQNIKIPRSILFLP